MQNEKVHGQFLHFQQLDQQDISGKSGAAIPDWSHCLNPLFYNQDTITWNQWKKHGIYC